MVITRGLCLWCAFLSAFLSICQALHAPENSPLAIRSRKSPSASSGLLARNHGTLRNTAPWEPSRMNGNLQLRGGEKDIPKSMCFLHWWNTSVGAWVVTGLLGGAALFAFRPFPTRLPRMDEITPEMRAFFATGMVLSIVGGLLLLAGAAIKNALGEWTLGFEPFSSLVFLAGLSLLTIAVGETLHDMRRNDMINTGCNPYSQDFA